MKIGFLKVSEQISQILESAELGKDQIAQEIQRRGFFKSFFGRMILDIRINFSIKKLCAERRINEIEHGFDRTASWTYRLALPG